MLRKYLVGPEIKLMCPRVMSPCYDFFHRLLIVSKLGSIENSWGNVSTLPQNFSNL